MTDSIQQQILHFVRQRFFDGDPREELQLDTPLLELGILDSLDTVTLLGFVKQELGVTVPVHHVHARNLASVAKIAELVCARLEPQTALQ